MQSSVASRFFDSTANSNVVAVRKFATEDLGDPSIVIMQVANGDRVKVMSVKKISLPDLKTSKFGKDSVIFEILFENNDYKLKRLSFDTKSGTTQRQSTDSTSSATSQSFQVKPVNSADPPKKITIQADDATFSLLDEENKRKYNLEVTMGVFMQIMKVVRKIREIRLRNLSRKSRRVSFKFHPNE